MPLKKKKKQKKVKKFKDIPLLIARDYFKTK